MRLRLPLAALTIGVAALVGSALAASPPTARGAAARASKALSYTTAGAVPAGFQPGSFTAISELDWWVLGKAPCAKHMCTALVRTTNGGRSFTRIPAPPVYWGVANVRFANARDGYAYGPGLYETHNGGRTWAAVDFGVYELSVGDGYVYAVKPTPPGGVMRSRVGRYPWTNLPGLAGRAPKGPAGQAVGGLWVQGATVILQWGSRMLVSHDQGQHFTHVRGVQRAGDCGYDAVGSPFAIWGLCTTGTAPDDVVRSTDGGNTFTTAAQVPNGPIDAFAAASSSVAVASGQGPLYRTVNGGASWSAVSAPAAGWNYLGFTDATHGVAIGEFSALGRSETTSGRSVTRLYYTTDGGASYHRVALGP